MKGNKQKQFRASLFGIIILTVLSPLLQAEDRLQIELYGSYSLINPKDLNLFSKAEEQYNDIYFVQRLFGYRGYFLNDFPEITTAVPSGFRVKYLVSDRLAVSVDLEGFQRSEEIDLSGTLWYSPSWSLHQTKNYFPYRLGLKGISVMGGAHYRFPAGRSTELELGIAAGWTRASFDFLSAWSFTINFSDEDYTSSSVDGGTLEGNGKGSGFAAKAMVRLNRSLGRGIGFFVETAAVVCRLKSISGSGRETRLGLPGETTWDGPWGIKKENIVTSWDEATVYVPTNYWEGWVADQRDREFILDLSSLRLGAGLYLRF